MSLSLFLRRRFQPVSLILRSAISTDSILSNWPGEYRFGINNLTRHVSEDEKFTNLAKSKFIDQFDWIRFISSFRRKLMIEPLKIFDNKKRPFLKFSKLIRSFYFDANGNTDIAKHSQPLSVEDLKRLEDCKLTFFEIMINIAEVELKDSIFAHKTLCATSDLRIPNEWYPLARLMKRKIIYHGGPTNSGKTYHALQRLKEADPTYGGGLYCGPLRLLALEVFEQMNKQGVYMNLLTGQEKREVPFATHIASTVEMVNIRQKFDVAVIDEIQMIADPQRGHSWTRALLGIQAREIHLCGGLESKDLVQSLVSSTGDEFELREYARKTELVIEEESLKGDYSNIQPGDCVVAFSRSDIFSIRRQIESLTPYKCAVIYGQLPPETRSTQARLFNEQGSGYDVLVASDAIGMGLNLNIRRTVFHTTIKRGESRNSSYWVSPSNIKQIAGRAGRLSSSYPTGYVTAWQEADLAYIRAVMKIDIPQIPAAGIFPNKDQIQLFSTQLQELQKQSILASTSKEVKEDEEEDFLSLKNENPINPSPPIPSESATKSDASSKIDVSVKSTRLSYLIERFIQLSQTDGRYFMSDHDNIILISNWLQSIPLPLVEKFEFANAPVSSRDDFVMNQLYEYASAHALGRPVPINVRLPRFPPRDVLEFSELCVKHNILDLYIWLSLRFPKFFMERDLCIEQKALALNMIELSLYHSSDRSLAQKYSLSEHYQKIRNVILKLTDGLPPEQFGTEIRELTRINLEKIPVDDRFKFPHSEEELASIDISTSKSKKPQFVGNLKRQEGAKPSKSFEIQYKKINSKI